MFGRNHDTALGHWRPDQPADWVDARGSKPFSLKALDQLPIPFFSFSRVPRRTMAMAMRITIIIAIVRHMCVVHRTLHESLRARRKKDHLVATRCPSWSLVRPSSLSSLPTVPRGQRVIVQDAVQLVAGFYT
jgi:hypothetical protein